MRSALVTGAAGFLGRYIVGEFVARGWRVTGIDRAGMTHDQARRLGLAGLRIMQLPAPDLPELLEVLEPEVIVHAAGPASVPASVQSPATDFRAATLPLLSMLEAMRISAAHARLIFLSSAAVYGNPAQLPVREDQPADPISPYGYHKLACESLLTEYRRIYNVPSCSMRIFSAYGPGLRRQVLWDIAQKALCQRVIELHGTGDETRDFIHARDVARGIVEAAEHAACEAEAYNLAAGREVRIHDLASRLINAMGRDVEIAYSGSTRPGDPLRWCADVSKIGRLGFAPGIGIEQGIREYAEWLEYQSPRRLVRT